MNRHLPVFLAASLVLLAVAAPALAQQTDAEWLENCRSQRSSSPHMRHCEVRHHELTAENRVLAVQTGNGAIAVRGWDGADIRVAARVQTRAGSKAAAEALARAVLVHAANGRVTAEGPQRREAESWSVNYEVLVPRRMDLRLETGNGAVTVSDVAGRIDLSTTNGALSLTRVGGAVSARTTNGSVVVELAGDRWQGEGLDAETTNGNVTLHVPDGYSAELVVGTRHGAMVMELPVSEGYRSGAPVRTTLGSGGPRVRVTTGNGAVTVRRSRD